MSSSDTRPSADLSPEARGAKAERVNDAYGWIDRYAADLHRAAKELVEKGEAARVSDEAIAQIITAAVRLYYAKSELEERPVRAVVQEGAETLTATEMLVAVSEMLRDVGLGPMELGLWFRRRPGENHPDENSGNHSATHLGNTARSKP
jgi:hypothetical protein